MVTIAALPPDILVLVPRHLHHLDDFVALASTCRILRDALHTCLPGDLLALCSRSRTTFFRPDPHFLLSALIPAISRYACSSPAHRVEVKEAIWHGCDGLLDWACHTPMIAVYADWSVQKIRELWEWRMRVFNPLSDLIDRCIGKQWYQTPDFWYGGAEDAYTINADPEKQVLEVGMYGDMFGMVMDTHLAGLSLVGTDLLREESKDMGRNSTLSPTQALSISLRLDFVKYLFPDWRIPTVTHGSANYSSSRPPSPTDYFIAHNLPTTKGAKKKVLHPLRAVQTTFGPYSGSSTEIQDSQKALTHLLDSSILWNKLVDEIRKRCGGDFDIPIWGPPHRQLEEVPWKQLMWEMCPYALGSIFLDMVAEVWRVMGPKEVELENMRRIARANARERHEEKYDDEAYGRARAERDKMEIEERGTGWGTLRKWREVIDKLQEEPKKVRVGLKETHEEYPDFLSDMLVATHIARGKGA